MNATRLLALLRKEFLTLLKDKRSRFVVIGPPIIQLLIFGYAATYDLTNVPFAVFNEDPGPAARQFLARFQGSETFKEVSRFSHLGQMQPFIDRKEGLLVVHVGPHFSRDLSRGTSATVQVIVDGRDSNTALIALNYVRAIVEQFNVEWARSHGGPTPLARLVTRAWYNPNLESRWFFIPGIVGLLTLVVGLTTTALTVAREREQGTFDQLLVTPMHPIEILLGKALPGLLIGVAQGTAIIVIAVLWFKIPFLGSLGALYTGLFLFLISVIGAGLAISALARTQQQALLMSFLFLAPSVLLSGFATPIANMPPFVQTLTHVNPLRYFMIILRGVFLEGASFGTLASQYWPMVVIAVLTLFPATWLFRHRLH